MNYTYLWLGVLVITLIAEVATATALVTVWFSVGALLALICNILHLSIYIQVVVFIIASILCLIFIRPLMYKMIRPAKANTNADRVIDQIYTIISDSNDDHIATLKANGFVWNARTIDNADLKVNDRVLVKSIEGSKLIVEKI